LNDNFKIDSSGIMYLKCVKALYGHVEATRLFYNDLNKTLVEKMGFVRNGYDPCVYNKKTEDGFVTVHTHVDDLKISSKSEGQLLKVIDDLKDIYREITVHEDDTHDYLGMIMSRDRKNQCVTINMEKYVIDCIEEFEKEVPNKKLKPACTPATNYLFKVRTGSNIDLPKQKASLFHSMVAKLLFVAKRA